MIYTPGMVVHTQFLCQALQRKLDSCEGRLAIKTCARPLRFGSGVLFAFKKETLRRKDVNLVLQSRVPASHYYSKIDNNDHYCTQIHPLGQHSHSVR